jgi:hypothetical protein
MKSLTALWKEASDELGAWCHTSTTLDYKKLERRVEHEGDSFLTITLPKFGKDFEEALDQGKVDPCHFAGFRRSGGLPLFLGGFLERVFDRGTALLLTEPDVDSIFAIRQLTLMFKKMLLPCSDARVEAAISGYVECEQEVKQWDIRNASEDFSDFRRMSLLLFGSLFQSVDRKVADGQLTPRHGPGSTADRLLGNQKYNQVEWTTRLESVFPFLENALPSPSYWERMGRVTFLEPDAERPVRVVTVPKTLETPRIIAIEPTCMQFMQQAILEAIVQEAEDGSRAFVGNTALDKGKNLSYGFVGFRDQDPNREMAREGSSNQTLATLDMSEASDRVSNQHVELLVGWWPHLFEALQVTRSTKADVPGHGVLPLSKFASMGSAVCFPIEAMVFCTLVFLGIQDQLNRRLTVKDVLSLRGQVRVYGDDIIVPVDCVNSVIARLESFGLKVNMRKSFWNGKFRESCGGDYYDGQDVTPVRVRRQLPSSRKQADRVISLVELRNQFYEAGMWKTAGWLDKRVRGVLGHFPIVEPTSPALGRRSVSFGYEAQRTCNRLHRPLVKAWAVRSKSPASPLDDVGALTKWFLKRGDEPFFDVDHLQRAGRPRFVDIKIGWMTPF